MGAAPSVSRRNNGLQPRERLHAFSAYEGFVKEHPLPADFIVRDGALPGDRAVSLERGGLKVVLVGLNPAFLQPEGGDPSSRDAERLADNAGLHRGRIDLSGSAQAVWFDVLDEARKSGRISAVLEAAREEYPTHPDLLRLSRAVMPAATQVAAAPAGVANSYALYDALARLLTAQFEEVLFRLSVPTHYLPSPTSSQSERAMALVRLLDGEKRLPELAAAIEKVGGRLS